MSCKRPVTPRSRFAEGSMNDRASTAPPPQFLGPHPPSPASLPDLAAPSAQADAAAALDGRRPRPASISERRGLSGLWEGLREKIWGRRRPASFDGVSMPRAEPPVTQGGVERPTREEMLASYQELMAAGFFQARAIQGTRPGTRPPSRDYGQAYARPRLETIYSPRHIRADGTLDVGCAEQAEPATPDSRGKKRAHAGDGEEEREGEGEKGRSAVRKLRKTTRSITELHARLRRAREETRPPVSYPGFRARRSVSGPNRLAKRAARPSSSSGADRAEISAPVTAPVRLVPGAFDAMRGLDAGSVRLRRVPTQGALRATAGDDSRPESPMDASDDCVAPQAQGNCGPATGTQSANWTAFEDATDGPDESWAPPPLRRRGAARPPKTPLSVIPDVNRGIPVVPAIPEQFKMPVAENGVSGLVAALSP